MHWSLTQFTPACTEVHPGTLVERTFAVFTLLFALVVFSSFVSSITSAMTSLRELSSQMYMTKEFSKLKWYLRDNSVPSELAVRINKYLVHAMSEKKHRIKPKEVELLEWLSEPLAMELKAAVVGPVLRVHHFFSSYESVGNRALVVVCTTATTQNFVSIGDVLFTTGETATRMFFVGNGAIIYSRETVDMSEAATVLKTGQWICEMAIWLHWVHQGELRAASHGSIVALDAEGFASATAQHKAAYLYAQAYAAMYKEHLEKVEQDEELSDLSCTENPGEIRYMAKKSLDAVQFDPDYNSDGCSSVPVSEASAQPAATAPTARAPEPAPAKDASGAGGAAAEGSYSI